MADITLVKLPKENIEHLFNALDKNNDAVINHSELIDGINIVYPFIADKIEYSTFFTLANNMFFAADTHVNGVLTYLELLQFFSV
jgi:Ca2+-binding EF-hand superfamily protein|tara:strand:- start:320 stop:574 length:255 start_codon:yes stop_codon:yes gene_type:complete